MHITSITPPLLIEVPVQSQKSERLCNCVLGVSIVPLSKISHGYQGYDTWVPKI